MVNASTVDIGDADIGAAVELAIAGDTAELAIAGDRVELVIGGATHLVQMVLVLVLTIVDKLVVLSMEVTPFEIIVLVTGQLVTVGKTSSVVTAATVDTGDAAELVIGGATHLVQMVLMLVERTVERLVAFMTEVVPLATFVVVIGQLVMVV